MKGHFRSQKRGVTLIELLVAMSLIGVIGLITSSIFSVSARSYRDNIQKSFFQKDLNIVIDGLANVGKGGTEILLTQDGFTIGPETLIIATPAEDEDRNFIYSGDTLEKDLHIYYLSGTELRRRIISHPLGRLSGRNGSDAPLLKNVSLFEVTYSPGVNEAELIKVKIGLSRDVGNRSISLTQEREFRLRNK